MPTKVLPPPTDLTWNPSGRIGTKLPPETTRYYTKVVRPAAGTVPEEIIFNGLPRLLAKEGGTDVSFHVRDLHKSPKANFTEGSYLLRVMAEGDEGITGQWAELPFDLSQRDSLNILGEYIESISNAAKEQVDALLNITSQAAISRAVQTALEQVKKEFGAQSDLLNQGFAAKSAETIGACETKLQDLANQAEKIGDFAKAMTEAKALQQSLTDKAREMEELGKKLEALRSSAETGNQGQQGQIAALKKEGDELLQKLEGLLAEAGQTYATAKSKMESITSIDIEGLKKPLIDDLAKVSGSIEVLKRRLETELIDKTVTLARQLRELENNRSQIAPSLRRHKQFMGVSIAAAVLGIAALIAAAVIIGKGPARALHPEQHDSSAMGILGGDMLNLSAAQKSLSNRLAALEAKPVVLPTNATTNAATNIQTAIYAPVGDSGIVGSIINGNSNVVTVNINQPAVSQQPAVAAEESGICRTVKVPEDLPNLKDGQCDYPIKAGEAVQFDVKDAPYFRYDTIANPALLDVSVLFSDGWHPYDQKNTRVYEKVQSLLIRVHRQPAMFHLNLNRPPNRMR